MTYAHIAKGGSLRFTQWYDFMDLTNYILGGGGGGVKRFHAGAERLL